MKRKLFLVLILGIAVLSCGQKQNEANELNNTVSQQTTQQGQNFQNNNIQEQQSNTQSQQQQVSSSYTYCYAALKKRRGYNNTGPKSCGWEQRQRGDKQYV